MKISKVCELLRAEQICGEGDREVSGGYAGDFLSNCMGKAVSDGVWLTVMNNVNVAAVAVLCEVGAVVLCEGVRPSPELEQKCRDQGIFLLSTPFDVFQSCGRLYPELK